MFTFRRREKNWNPLAKWASKLLFSLISTATASSMAIQGQIRTRHLYFKLIHAFTQTHKPTEACLLPPRQNNSLHQTIQFKCIILSTGSFSCIEENKTHFHRKGFAWGLSLKLSKLENLHVTLRVGVNHTIILWHRLDHTGWTDAWSTHCCFVCENKSNAWYHNDSI